MIDSLKRSFYKNGYLLIIALWLLTFSFIASHKWYAVSSPAFVKNNLENYIKGSEQQFDAFTLDKAFFNAVVQGSYTVDALEYFKKDIGLFIYDLPKQGKNELKFWNTNKTLPRQLDLFKPDGKYFIVQTNGEFEFIKKTVNTGGTVVIATTLIPLRWNYFVKTKYLYPEFPGLKNLQKKYVIANTNADIHIKNGDGKVLFGLKDTRADIETPETWSTLFIVLSIVFVLMFINVVAFDLVKTSGWKKAFTFLVSIIVTLRTLSYLFKLTSVKNIGFFDSNVYASSTLHRSLADLFINVLLVFWMVSFLKFSAIKNFQEKKITGHRQWILMGVLSILLIALSFLCAGVVSGLIKDSQISFDVTNFFSLNIYSLFSFVILCFIVMIFFHSSHLILLFIYKCDQVSFYAKYLYVTVTGLLYLTVTINNTNVIINLLILLWLIAFMLLMEARKEDIPVPLFRSSFFIIWLIFFAASTSSLIIYHNHKREFDKRIHFAELLVERNDPATETFLTLGITEIDDEFLSGNFYRFMQPASNREIKDSLLRENFSSYLSSYDTHLYTFTAAQRPLFNTDPVSFARLTNIIYNRSKKSTYPDVYSYYRNDIGLYSLIYFKKVKDSSGTLLGYFVVVADPHLYKSDIFSPEIFASEKSVDEGYYNSYTYAIYDRGKIAFTSGNYNFRSFIPRQLRLKQQYKELKDENVMQLWYNLGKDKMAIVVKEGSILLEAITLFAYLFAAFLFVVMLMQVAHFLVSYKFRIKRMMDGIRLSIRTQVQGTIIFVSVFSFVVIGFATISFYINRFNTTNTDRLIKAIEVIAADIKVQPEVDSAINHNIPVTAAVFTKLDETIKRTAAVHNVDVNYYDTKGNLLVYTQPFIYQNQVLSKMLEPNAYYNLLYNNNIRFLQEEKVRSFSFISIYIPLKDKNGKATAFLNIPYLNSQKELNQEISNFLVTLINLNAFIFVLAGVIAVLITNRITRSFSLIANKMKEINLGKANEKIIWNNNDEVGALVHEYNQMVKKLERSAAALAKSEREGAWREMARQVAHEIKNPLTPMKLSIQYLQKAIKEKSPDAEQLSEKVSATLVEQIDQLAKIASDFSQFANIGNVNTETFDVADLINSLLDLYRPNDKLQITYTRPASAIITADKLQINRLFTNLLQNAIEASHENGVIPLSINVYQQANKITVSITDQGSGIPPARQKRMFTPNFTTKSSGTGLGLAICKGIVEKANGKIWFETAEGKGTTFFVQLPAAV